MSDIFTQDLPYEFNDKITYIFVRFGYLLVERNQNFNFSLFCIIIHNEI